MQWVDTKGHWATQGDVLQYWGNNKGCWGKKNFHYYISPLLHNMVFMLVFIIENSIIMKNGQKNH
jgi:hypothetical protein